MILLKILRHPYNVLLKLRALGNGLVSPWTKAKVLSKGTCSDGVERLVVEELPVLFVNLLLVDDIWVKTHQHLGVVTRIWS